MVKKLSTFKNKTFFLCSRFNSWKVTNFLENILIHVFVVNLKIIIIHKKLDSIFHIYTFWSKHFESKNNAIFSFYS